MEHKIYPEAVRLFALGKIKISGRRTIIKNKESGPPKKYKTISSLEFPKKLCSMFFETKNILPSETGIIFFVYL